MLKLRMVVCALLCALAMCGCACRPVVSDLPPVQPAQLAPAPAEVMVVREANFRQRLLMIFSPSSPMPMRSPSSSGDARR